MVTYSEYITWPGAGYVLTFSLKLARSATFSMNLSFRVCFKHSTTFLQGKYALCVQVVLLSNTLLKPLNEALHCQGKMVLLIKLVMQKM